MPLSSFCVQYRFGGVLKSARLPEWLSDSVQDDFGGDIGLTQTTRVSVHQTKVRLLAAAIDAVETERDQEVGIDEIDAALVEHGLITCIERHRGAWKRLVDGPVPTFEYVFDLLAPRAEEPAFLQCPKPQGDPIKITDGLRLLPDLGFSVPAQVPVSGETDLAFQLAAFAGGLGYQRGRPITSRPMGQTVAVDVPGRPAWRVRHELDVLLRHVERGREELGLRGSVTFAWLLPFLPKGKPIPRAEQHPLLLDVPSPVRVRSNLHVAVYNQPCVVGETEMALPNAALAHKSWWAATGVPGIAFTKTDQSKKGGQTSRANAVVEAGLDPKPDLVQDPYGSVPSSDKLLCLLRSTPMGGSNEGLHPPVLASYLLEGAEATGDKTGAELVIEGEPKGNSTTAFWLDVRVPLPEPAAGAETGHARWRGWQGAVERQLAARSKAAAQLAIAAEQAWLGRRQAAGRKPSASMKAKASAFARRWKLELETETDPDLWTIAARTWGNREVNEARWGEVLDRAVYRAATRAFEALGGYDNSSALLASAGLLALAEWRGGRAK